MKKEITLKFVIDDEKEGYHFEEAELKKVLKANDLAMALHEMHEELFRPARKHGYEDYVLQEIIDYADDREMLIPNIEHCEEFNIVTEMISALEKKYLEILEDYGIDLDELIY